MGIRSFIKMVMVRPTKDGVYAPSRNDPSLENMTDEEFYSYFADTATGVPVSRDKDGVSNPKNETLFKKHSTAGYWLAEATDEEIAADELNATYSGADFSIVNSL